MPFAMTPSLGTSVESGEITDGTVTDSDLASPNNSVYRLIRDSGWVDIVGGTANATYFIHGAGALLAATDLSPLGVRYFDPADYAVAGKTTKYRLRAVCLSNTVSVGTTTLTVGLYPISAVAGGNNAITMTADTVVTGSTVPFVDPATSTRAQGNSGDFTAPAAGYYAIGVVVSATTAANSELAMSAQLQVRNT